MAEIIKDVTRYAITSNQHNMIISAILEALADSEVIDTGVFGSIFQIYPKGVEDPKSYVRVYTDNLGIHIAMYDKDTDQNYIMRTLNYSNMELYVRLIEYGDSAVLTIAYGSRTVYEIGGSFEAPHWISWNKGVPSQTNDAIRIAVGPATDYNIGDASSERRRLKAISIDILDNINDTSINQSFKDCFPTGWESPTGNEISVNSNDMYYTNAASNTGSFINPDGHYRNQEFAENTVVRRYGNLYRPMLFDNIYHIDIQSDNSIRDDNITIGDHTYVTSYGIAIRKD